MNTVCLFFELDENNNTTTDLVYAWDDPTAPRRGYGEGELNAFNYCVRESGFIVREVDALQIYGVNLPPGAITRVFEFDGGAGGSGRYALVIVPSDWEGLDYYPRGGRLGGRHCQQRRRSGPHLAKPYFYTKKGALFFIYERI